MYPVVHNALGIRSEGVIAVWCLLILRRSSLKCPTCNAWTNVLESRPLKGSIKRRRECANMHRFTTYETEFNHERSVVLTGRRVFNWMLKLLNGETRNVVQPKQGDLFESESKQAQTGKEVLSTEQVLGNIMNAIARSKDEKR